MIGDTVLSLLFGLGFVAIVEGLMLALAPWHLRRLLEILCRLEDEPRRMIALICVAVGIALIWIARG